MLKNVSRTLIKSRTLTTVARREKHTLPALSYPVDKGVPPCISGRQLDFHYNKHHKTYVDKLNGLIEGTPFEGQPLDKIIQKSAFDAKTVPIFNNAAQHFNHAFYWKSIVPNGAALDGTIKTHIVKQWGSVDEFKKQFTETAVNLFGSGWVWLVLKDGALSIWKGSNAETPITENLVPLLTCDVWEHAYYLDHQNRRPDYLKTFWDVVNWGFVNECLEEAVRNTKVKL
jgi:Fe-Mn family superoxide dismutase